MYARGLGWEGLAVGSLASGPVCGAGAVDGASSPAPYITTVWLQLTVLSAMLCI